MKKLNTLLLIKISTLGLSYQFTLWMFAICMFLVYQPTILNKEFIHDSILSIFWTVICATLWEEIFFRKYLFAKFKNRFSIKLSIFISSLLFGLIHINPTIIIFATITGIISCIIYQNTKNIIYSIIFHSSANLFSLIIRVYINNYIYDLNSYNPNIALGFVIVSIAITSVLSLFILKGIINYHN
ncbi:CPBP family intramembrane metalloprotease [Clostridium gasigenes]|uniref:CPBP family intramembrane glutamic endopeptidase n=1 Tax=Clostridium gasigenes TaxID=94869 RepID=UPI001C0DEF97|nr:CPBP family intramembrane glutamic endopeptidase [Clostridium gasigenes]MBU3133580.1 CPBP family intramembrane metalloprotease [Clostridium gasigenes]